MLNRTIGQVYISAQIFSCPSTWSLYWQLALCFDQFKQIKEILVIYDTWRLPKFSSATKKDCGMFRLEVNKMKMGWWWWLKGMGGDLGSGFQGSYLTTQKPRKSQSWMRNRSSGFLPTRTSPWWLPFELMLEFDPDLDEGLTDCNRWSGSLRTQSGKPSRIHCFSR